MKSEVEGMTAEHLTELLPKIEKQTPSVITLPTAGDPAVLPSMPKTPEKKENPAPAKTSGSGIAELVDLTEGVDEGLSSYHTFLKSSHNADYQEACKAAIFSLHLLHFRKLGDQEKEFDKEYEEVHEVLKEVADSHMQLETTMQAGWQAQTLLIQQNEFRMRSYALDQFAQVVESNTERKKRTLDKVETNFVPRITTMRQVQKEVQDLKSTMEVCEAAVQQNHHLLTAAFNKIPAL